MIGIYKLTFANKFAYIGQSINIGRRIKQHIYTMKRGIHHNKNILELYNRYGEPVFNILCECKIEELDKKEFEYLEKESLTIVNLAPVDGVFDPDLVRHHNRKYTKEQILLVAELLSSGDYSFDDIENISKVNRSTISLISIGEAHNWISEVDEDMWLKIQNLKNTRQKAKSKKYSDDDIYEVLVYLGDKKFTHKYINEVTNIPVSVIQSISGGYAYSELKNIYPEEYTKMLTTNNLRKLKDIVKVKSPEGEIFEVANRSEFARQQGFRKASFLDLCNNKIKNYRGWSVIQDS